jgi:hypothetical protein
MMRSKQLLSLILAFIIANVVQSQQFNSDSYLSKAHGTITIIPTFGERNKMLMNTYSLFPRWEFTMAAFLYNNDNNSRTDDGYSTTLYAKYMFYENARQSGGFAMKAGTGMFPGTAKEEVDSEDAFQTYWVNAPATIPFFKDKLSIDLMPGASYTRNYGPEETGAWSFTYSVRAAWYPINFKWSIVGEVFGSEGESSSLPEYKMGLRWEPSKYAVFALTYGQEFNGNNGAGFEIGVMLFTPPFACLGGCKTKK